MKNIAKVRGETVSLDEMERVLRALPYVRDAACVSVPHRFFGEEIIAAVVFPEGADPPDPRDHLRSTFAPTALPSRIVRLDAIPRTATGKVLRPVLAQKLASPGDDGAS
jgi:acyl-coenzyme A synthetase/AMP-(fatty) acid ligase